MVQIVSGVVLLVLGALFLVQGLRRRGDAGRQGPLGGLGGIMLGLIAAFLGVALLLPARDATPTPGQNTNAVDEAVQESGE